MATTIVTENEILEQLCPRCGALRRRPCLSRNGVETKTHKGRIEAALAEHDRENPPEPQEDTAPHAEGKVRVVELEAAPLSTALFVKVNGTWYFDQLLPDWFPELVTTVDAPFELAIRTVSLEAN
jgi:hypothetical protein